MEEQKQQSTQQSEKSKKSIFTKWWIWVGIIFLALLLSVIMLIIFVQTHEPSLSCGAYEVC